MNEPRSPRPSESASEAKHTSALQITAPPELLDDLVERVAAIVVDRLQAKPEPYMSPLEAAEYLGYGASRERPERAIYELVESGRLRCYRDGRRMLLRREDLDGVLDRQEPAC